MKQTFTAITRSILSVIGVVMTTLSAVIFASLFFVDVVGHKSGLYSGIIGYLILPAVFIFGLVLIPLGVWLQRRREKKTGKPVAAMVLDFNRPELRRTALVVLVLSAINIVIVAVGTYKGVVVMESREFCGETCHKVMTPEFTVYKRSPHSRVECVQCHIGSGADWFAKSKLSGSWQLVSVAFDLYPRPIPTPLHNLRPARETCEQCHWPEKFVGERLRTFTHFSDDEQAVAKKNVLLMNIGGIRNGVGNGIHWHVDPSHKVRYRSDTRRRTIYEVELTQADGGVTNFKNDELKEDGGVTDWRAMDCIDCHNRPTHIYETPLREVERSMEAGRLDIKIPWVKREGLRVIQETYPSHESARAGIRKSFLAFYEKDYPELAKDTAKMDAAIAELTQIYVTNIFPEMKIVWGTYPNFLNEHDDTNGTGCFRCHDNDHKTKDGTKKISKNCSLCHNVLANEEENPEILEQLHPE